MTAGSIENLRQFRVSCKPEAFRLTVFEGGPFITLLTFENCQFCRHQDTPLPWIPLVRSTIERFTQAMDQVSAATPQSFAKCRRTKFLE
jgi:hypothetical protein